MSGSTTIRESHGRENFSAYLALPENPNGAGIVLLQEIFGINSFVRHAANCLAGQGYRVIAPDLFWRQRRAVELDSEKEADRTLAMQYFKFLDETKAVADCIAALNELRRVCPKIGALGYCLGGKLAYLLAARSNIDAAVSYYGVGIQGALDEMGNIGKPVLLHLAREDSLCPPEAQARIKSVAAANRAIEVADYADVGHAFARSGSSAFRAVAAATANRRSLVFLQKALL